jgi:hypothetical protein
MAYIGCEGTDTVEGSKSLIQTHDSINPSLSNLDQLFERLPNPLRGLLRNPDGN